MDIFIEGGKYITPFGLFLAMGLMWGLGFLAGRFPRDYFDTGE